MTYIYIKYDISFFKCHTYGKTQKINTPELYFDVENIHVKRKHLSIT